MHGGTRGDVRLSGRAGEHLASSAVSAALRYRAQAPVIDGLMKEVGLDGSTLENLVAGIAPKAADVPTVTVLSGESKD